MLKRCVVLAALIAAPVLILALESPSLLHQALRCTPVPNTCLEVPSALFGTPESLALLSQAVRNGHQLIRRADFAEVRHEYAAPLDVRSLLALGAEEALAAAQRSASHRPRNRHDTT